MESLGAGRLEKSLCTHTTLIPQTHWGDVFKMQVQSFTLKVPSFRMDVPGFRREAPGLRINVPSFMLEVPAPQPILNLLSASKVVRFLKLRTY